MMFDFETASRLPSRSQLSLQLVLALILSVGCSRSNPVDEISVADSGIEITESISVSQSDWNAWRGPRTDGSVDAQSLPTQWDETTNIQWRADIPGRGHSSPIVVGSSVYVATADDQAETQSVICLDREDGATKWTTVIHQGNFPSRRSIHAKGTNANGTIACDGSRLLVGMLNNDAIIATALDLEGKILWQQEVGKFVSRFGYAPSPILYKSLVIFSADNEGGGYIAALDRATGKIAWRVARPNQASYSSPTVAKVDGKDQVLISGCESVSSYDPATGKTNWQTPCLTMSTCGTVVTTADRIFAAGGYPDPGIVCLSGDGKLIWSNDAKLYEPSLAIVGDTLVGVRDDGIAFAWSTVDGEEMWKKRLGGDFSASPIISDGMVFVPNLSGDTFIFRASEKYDLVSKNRLGDDCYASPAASDGKLFLRIGVGEGESRKEQVVCIAEPQ